MSSFNQVARNVRPTHWWFRKGIRQQLPVANNVTLSASPMTTERLEHVHNATLGIRVQLSLRACLRLAVNATWGLITRKWRSTTSRSTVSCSRRSAIC